MESNKFLKPLLKTPVTSAIAERITNFISDSGLKAGDRLPPERELMQQLSIGRSTLREAVATLKSLGIVEVKLGSGMFVGKGDTTALAEPLSWSALMSQGTIEQVVEARIIIECELAALAAARASSADISNIDHCLQLLKQHPDKAYMPEYDEFQFHMAVAEASGNTLLCRVLNTVQRMHKAMTAKADARRYPEAEQKERAEELPEIADAIRSHDPDRAREAMRRHLINVKSEILAHGQ